MSYYLPPEIWTEIFHRQPPKSLVKCISVCKAWRSLITDQSFIHSHLSYTAQTNHENHSLFLHLRRWKKLAPSDYDNEEYDDDNEEFHSFYSEVSCVSIFKSPFIIEYKFGLTVGGTCNGLVCFVGYSKLGDIGVMIMNPSIRKYIVLPKPTITSIEYDPSKADYCMLGFGYDSRNKDFKVIRIAGCNRRTQKPFPIEVEIYSLATNKWKSITDRTLSGVTYPHDGQVFLNGALHWVVCRNCHWQCPHFILTFDLIEENFGELMLPQPCYESSFETELLDGSDSLALVLHNYGLSKFNVWVMKEYGAADSWTPVFSFDSAQYGGISKVLALNTSGEVVLQTPELIARSAQELLERPRLEIIILDPKKDLVKCVGLEKYDLLIIFVGHYMESLFLLDWKNDVLTF